MAKLNLTTPGMVALVDDDLVVAIAKHLWYCDRDSKRPYVYRKMYREGKQRKVYLHREVARLRCWDTRGRKVDHRDGNVMDNRTCNLRLCTNRQNLLNQSVRDMRKTSRFKGVCRPKTANRWRSSITVHSRTITLGWFDTEVEAAKAYDTAARELHGEFARTNESLQLLGPTP